MSFDLEKFQAVAELGEVIRLQNEAMDRLKAFRQSRPYLIMPNLAKMVEENMKENVQVLYKELNNLHRPAEQQTRYICNECKMAFLVKLPGGICDECRSRQSTQPREYVVNAPPVDVNAGDDEMTITPAQVGDDAGMQAGGDSAAVAGAGVAAEDIDGDDGATAEAEVGGDPSDFRAESEDISVSAGSGDLPVDDVSARGIADDAEHAATGDKLPIEEATDLTGDGPVDASGEDATVISKANAAAAGDTEAAGEMSEEFMKFMGSAGTGDDNLPDSSLPGETDVFTETDLNVTDDTEGKRDRD